MRDSSGIKIICAQRLRRNKILLPELSNNSINKMKQKIRSISVLGSIAIAFMMFFAPILSVVPVQAQQSLPCSTNATGGDCPQAGLTDVGNAFPTGAKRALDIPTTVHLVINWALYIAAIIAVVFVIIGGFMYMTSAGDPGKATKGRTTLTNALIGLVIIVMSYMLVQIVYNFLTK